MKSEVCRQQHPKSMHGQCVVNVSTRVGKRHSGKAQRAYAITDGMCMNAHRVSIFCAH